MKHSFCPNNPAYFVFIRGKASDGEAGLTKLVCQADPSNDFLVFSDISGYTLADIIDRVRSHEADFHSITHRKGNAS